MRLVLSLALLGTLSGAARLTAADPPGGLALVPADAAGFVHVRLADVWKHDLLTGLRTAVTAAGPKAVAAFEKQVYPDPSTLDRATVIVLPPAFGRGEPLVVGLIGFSAVIDAEKVRKLYLPDGAKAANGNYYASGDLALAFPDAKNLVVGPPDAVAAFVSRPATAEGPLAAALKLAASGPAIVAAVNARAIPIPPRAFEEIPEPVRPLLKADRVTLTIDLKADPVVEVRAGYGSAESAADAEKALKAAAEMAKQALAQPRAELEKKLYAGAETGPKSLKELPELAGSLVGIGAMNQLDALLAAPPLKRDGNDLTLSVTVPKELTAGGGAYTAVAVGLLLPAVQKVRAAAGRTTSQNNLKQIALAFHNYESAYGKLPGDICDKDGKALLSWRVAILPYIEQDALYRQFKLDEPWDSDHNKKLIPLMPKIYAIPGEQPIQPGKTYYQGFHGKKGAVIRPVFVDAAGMEAKFVGIPDGTSNTILVVEAADATDWTKPGGLAFDPAKELPRIGGHFAGGANAAFCDGSVRFLATTIDKMTLKALITANGGEVFNLDR